MGGGAGELCQEVWNHLASDGAYLYFSDATGVHAVDLASGGVSDVATGEGSAGPLVTHGGKVYVAMQNGSTWSFVSTSAAAGAVAESSSGNSGTVADMIVIQDQYAVVSTSSPDAIWGRYLDEGSLWGVRSAPAGSAIAADAENIYVEDSDGGGHHGLIVIPKAGGETLIAETGKVGSLWAALDAVYFTDLESATVQRANADGQCVLASGQSFPASSLVPPHRLVGDDAKIYWMTSDGQVHAVAR